MSKIKLKEGDIYNFSWNQKQRDIAAKGWAGSLDHCFEGLLIVMPYPQWNLEKEEYEHPLKLVDTFWGIKSTQNNKSFTLEEALEKGTLNFYCNLDEIERIKAYEVDDYADDDLYELSDQHRCSVYFYKKKGAKKSPAKKIATIEAGIRRRKSEIESAIWMIQRDTREIEDIKNLNK
jgi:hypothetical protein